MKNKKISIKIILIILLICTNIVLILIISNMKNKNIMKKQINKEQLEETTLDNAYIEAQLHFKELKDEQEKLLSFKSAIARAITEMGVGTSEDASVDIMANNIKNISSGNGIELPFDLLSNYFNIQQDGLRLYGPSTTLEKYRSSNVPFDLTEAKTLSIVGAAYFENTTVYISLTETPLTSHEEIVRNAFGTMAFPYNKLETLSIDISSVTGEKYIGIATTATSNYYIGVSNIIFS